MQTTGRRHGSATNSSDVGSVSKDLDFPKVELHVHLDGSARHSTLLELSREKNIQIGNATTIEELKKLVSFHEPVDLSKALGAFDAFMPVLAGDKDAIERVAYEMCEDEANSGVIYFEARYSPHLLCNTAKNSVATIHGHIYDKKGPLSPRAVVEAVSRGFQRGELDFKVKARTILCCICGFPDWNMEVLELANALRNQGVVGIDLAGWSSGCDEQFGDDFTNIFRSAAKMGIHRTVHAGESGEAKEVVRAIEVMKAERIGHGYRLVKDPEAYAKYALDGSVHFEICPLSSVISRSVAYDWPNHPLKKFADDGVNYSINTDDPLCLENTVTTEYELAYKKIGLSKQQLWKAAWNAAMSSFAEPELKQQILEEIEAAEPL